MSTTALRQHPNRRTWVIAWALTLALHALVFLGVQTGHRLVPAPARAVEPEPIQLTFVGPPPTHNEPKAPTTFTELPEDRRDKAPAHPDFLSNVTSRARDQVPGGDQSLPRMSGVADAPSVAMTNGQQQPRPTTVPPEQEAPRPPDASGNGAIAPPTNPGQGSPTPATPRDGGPSSPSVPGGSAAPGNSDIRQEEMDNPSGNAGLTGDVSLSTTQWEWAPWLQRFGRRLMQSWFAPPAYSMGLLKDGGWIVVEMEIARSGDVVRFDELEEQGHPSLTRAAIGALHSMGRLEALPADFPDKTLILRVRLVYPKIRPR